MNLPVELQEVILGYIDPKDKVYASMVCTIWLKIFKTQFNQKYKNADYMPTDCAYDLQLYFKKFGKLRNSPVMLKSNRYRDMRIHDVNIINSFVFYHINNNLMTDKNGSLVLEYYCIKDYVLKLDYIKYLLKLPFDYDNLLCTSLKHKSFKISKYLLIRGASTHSYINSIIHDKNINDNKFKDIIETLEFLIHNNALSITHLFGTIYPFKDCKYINQMLEFVKKYMSKEMIDILFILD